MGNDSFHLPGGDLLRKMLGGNPEPPKDIPKTAKRAGGGAGIRPAAAPEAVEELLPPETASEPKEEKPKVILRNPKWEAADVAGLAETLYDYQEKRWFGPARGAPVPPPWNRAETAVLQSLLDAAKGLRGQGRLSDNLQDAIEGTTLEIGDILASRTR